MSIKGLLSTMSEQKIMIDGIKEQRDEEILEQMKNDAVKGVSIRLQGVTVTAIDGLASMLDKSRQELLSNILEQAINEAVEGFFTPYLNTEKVCHEFWEDCEEAKKKGISYLDYKASKVV